MKMFMLLVIAVMCIIAGILAITTNVVAVSPVPEVAEWSARYPSIHIQEATTGEAIQAIAMGGGIALAAAALIIFAASRRTR